MRCLMFSFLFLFGTVSPIFSAETHLVTDMAGRQVEVPINVNRVLCSGPGCLRYLTYIQGQDLIVGVDSMEKRQNRFETRPYAVANPQFKTMPLFGEFRGFDSPELILGLEPQPQVIFKTYKNMGYDPDELQDKTGIPVVCLSYANLQSERKIIYDSLRLMAGIINRKARAERVCDFIEDTITDLKQRSHDLRDSTSPSCYVGGVAKKGPHGFQSTEPAYPPFSLVGAFNVACPERDKGKPLQHAHVSREQIVAWNPDIIFVDLSTTQLGEKSGAMSELATDPAYQDLKAVQNGGLFSVLPYNGYSHNYGSILADAYYVGKVLYPEQFNDVTPKVKADEIYSFLVGKPLFSSLNNAFNGTVFERLELR